LGNFGLYWRHSAPSSKLIGTLVQQFVSRQDKAAFAALLKRYGPMVLGVCLRVLHDEHRAEDAFQATDHAPNIMGSDLGSPMLSGHGSVTKSTAT
jgi:hypothetical protein